MANTKSIQKIIEYLESQTEAVSPSDISFNIHLRWKTIKECLEILKQNDRIIILTTGRTTLVKLKEENASLSKSIC